MLSLVKRVSSRRTDELCAREAKSRSSGWFCLGSGGNGMPVTLRVRRPWRRSADHQMI